MTVQPIVELHVHLEGTVGGASAPFGPRRRRGASGNRAGESWSSFLPDYLDRIAVLHTAEDFHAAAASYLDRMGALGVRHTEFFIDPQRHFDNGVRPEELFEGLDAARGEAEAAWGLSSAVIVCLARDRGAVAAQHAFDTVQPFAGSFIGVGLDSFEPGFPPSRFREVFARAGSEGLRRVAHAGAASGPAFIWEALDVLEVDRLAHGSRMLEDPALVARIRDAGVPVTLCPLADRLGDDAADGRDLESVLEDHALPVMLDEGLTVSIHSGDPVLHGAFLGEVFSAVAKGMGLSSEVMEKLARNSISSSFADEARKRELHTILDSRLTKEKALA